MAHSKPDEATVFDAARQLPDPQQRAAFLDAACLGDATLRQRVEELLSLQTEAGAQYDEAARQAPGAILNALPPGGSSTPAAHEKAGDRIGPYKLLEQIGAGGMGAVWMAEQTEPIRRRVALKVIKQGLDTGQVMARFEAERQALALMDHPHIAKVLDAGSTPEGRPYFVMELVKGIPLIGFCDEQRLSIQQRLELFMPVCQAIQHAHQKGVIHRDIKPSNVLVALYDGRPVPKVIDFGIAKATGQQLTEKTLFTSFGTVVGTLEYMSPEQAELNQLDIDTRSDIYSLGVLLYELLTGSTPLARETLRQAAFDEVLRRIREEEPPRPSTRLSDSKARLATLSAQRQLDSARLTKLLRGDLDWIVMKALEKDRNRRYESANSFAADIQRHLGSEPVSAGPPTARYRLSKFVRKHRTTVAVAGGFVLLLTVATAISTSLAFYAFRQAGIAAMEKQKADAAKARAMAARDAADGLIHFMQYDLRDSLGKLGQLPLMEGINARIRKYHKDYPAEEAGVKALREKSVSIAQQGDILLAQGDLTGARSSFEQSHEVMQKLAAADPGDARRQSDLGHSFQKLGQVQLAQGELAAARSSLAQSRQIRQKLAADAPGNPEWQRDLGASFAELGKVQWAQVDFASARSSFEEDLKIRQKLAAGVPGNAKWQYDLSVSFGQLGSVQQALGDQAGARSSFAQSQEIMRKLVASDPGDARWQRDWGITFRKLGKVQLTQGDRAGALSSFEQGHKIAQGLASGDPSNAGWQRELGMSFNNLGDVQWALGDRISARSSYVQGQRIMQKLAADTPGNAEWQRDLGISFDKLGDIQLELGDRAGALSSFAQSQAIRQKLAASDPDNAQWQRDLSISFNKLGDAQLALEDRARARFSFAQSVSIRQKLAAGEPGNLQWQRDLSVSMDKLGDMQLELGDRADARSSYEQSLKIAQKLATADPGNAARQRDLSISFNKLGDAQLELEDRAGARSSFEQSLRIRQKLAANEPGNVRWQRDLNVSLNRLGDVQLAMGDHAGARSSYEQGQKIAQKLAAGDPGNARGQRDLSISFDNLGEVQRALADWAAARFSFEQSLTIRQKLTASDPGNAGWQRDLYISFGNLGDLAEREGDPASARKAFEAALAIVERLVKLNPANTTWRKDLQEVRQRISKLP